MKFSHEFSHSLDPKRTSLKKGFEPTRKMLIPLAPIEEQYRTVVKVDELMAICDTLKARINQAQTIQLQLADTIAKQPLN